MDSLNVVVCSLAVYRMSYMISSEEGPFGIFNLLQYATRRQSNWIERGLNCALCISFWLSAAAGLLISDSLKSFVLYWFAIAGGCLVLHKILSKR